MPRDGSSDVLPGWLLAGGGEPDNSQPDPDGGWGPCLSAEHLAEERVALWARDRRPGLLVLGRGVADPGWIGRGRCGPHREDYYPAAVRTADIVSFDVYPVANYGSRLELVAQGVRNLQRWIGMSGTHPQLWTFVEAASLLGGSAPTPAQLRALIWLPVINGSDGLVLFTAQVSRDGQLLREDELFAHPELVTVLTRELRTLHALAAVLKRGRPIGGIQVRSAAAVSVRGIAGSDGDYVLAGSESGRAQVVAITLPERGLGRGQESGSRTATVIGEGRQVAVRRRADRGSVRWLWRAPLPHRRSLNAKAGKR